MSELLKLLPKTIKVCYADVDIDISNCKTFQEDCYGEYDCRSNKITVANDIEDKDLINTLMHELLHASAWYGGLKDDGAPLEDDNKEEHVINVLANQLCQILRDNPKLMTIIKKGINNKNGRTKKRDEVVALSQKTSDKYTFHKNRK